MKTKIVSFILCGDIFTVRKRSCGKVMFSQTCVKNSLGGGAGCVCIPASTGWAGDVYPSMH